MTPLRLLWAVFLAAQCVSGAVRAQENVELELVLAVDASSSVEYQEFVLQRNGLAEAFRSPEVKSAIRSIGPAGIAVSLVQWSGRGYQHISVPWMRIAGDADAEAFATEISGTRRTVRGFTDIAGALRFSTDYLLTNFFQGSRMVIDVSGDGTADDVSPAAARDAAVSLGIIVNGLVIYSTEYDLGELADISLLYHYQNEVIGGAGSFVMEAAHFRDFHIAIRRKLVREISGPSFVDAPLVPLLRARQAEPLVDGRPQDRL